MNAHERNLVNALRKRIETLEAALAAKIATLPPAKHSWDCETCQGLRLRLNEASSELRRLRGRSPIKTWWKMTAAQKKRAIRARMSERWQA